MRKAARAIKRRSSVSQPKNSPSLRLKRRLRLVPWTECSKRRNCFPAAPYNAGQILAKCAILDVARVERSNFSVNVFPCVWGSSVYQIRCQLYSPPLVERCEGTQGASVLLAAGVKSVHCRRRRRTDLASHASSEHTTRAVSNVNIIYLT